MSWLYSQALVEAYSQENFLDGEQSVQLNGSNTQQAYCAPDKMTDFSRLSQYGMTYKPLMENLGEELLTLYLEDFHAKICQPLETELDLTEKDQDFGERWGGLLAKLDPDTFLWKTPQCSLITDSTECLEIYPNWGLMQNGVLWEQTPLVHPTEGKDFGWWPTPVASDWMTGQTNGIEYTGKRFVRTSQKTGTEFGAKLTSAYRLMTGNHLPPNFTEWMMGWPIDWTDLKPVAMVKSQNVQQQHGES